MYQSQISKEVFVYLNNLRQNPKLAIPILQERLQYFNNTILNIPGQVSLKTNEGPRAYQDCINFLEKQKSLPPLTYDIGLEQACLDHVIDTGLKGITGHNGSDESKLSDRIERYGQWMSTLGEIISYGQFSGEDVIIQLIVDDGVPSRGHRISCFNSDYKVVGIAYGEHKQYETICVIDFAGKFTPNSGVSKYIIKAAQAGQGQLDQTSDKMDVSEQMTKQDLLEIEEQQKTYDGFFSEMPPDCVKMTTSTITKEYYGNKQTTTRKHLFMANGQTSQQLSIKSTQQQQQLIQVVMPIKVTSLD